MAFKIVLLRRAQSDVDVIYGWIAKRSKSGASRWYSAFLDATAALQRAPDACAAAPEDRRFRLNLRQRLFKTPRGRTYRIIFLIANKQVRVLRVRGPGQPPLRAKDLH